MNIAMGSQIFSNVEIPLLWGKRAVIEDKDGGISIISLEGENALVEILGSKPAPGIEYEPIEGGYRIIHKEKALYSYIPATGTISAIELNLPDCQIRSDGITVGGSVFSGNVVVGAAVGIVVDENGMGMGAPLPEGLARLVV